MDFTPQGGHLEGRSASLIDSLCRSWLDGALESGLSGMCIARATPDSLTAAVYSSDDLSMTLMSLHTELGEGPALQALRESGPIFISDLAIDALGGRWVTFAREAQAAGAVSYYVLPLQIGVVLVGVLALCGTRPAGLDQRGMSSLLQLRDATALLLLAHDERAATSDQDGGWMLSASDTVIHQATGMAMAQHGGTMDAALALLRAHAFGTGRTLSEVAQLIVQRRLRFDSGEPFEADARIVGDDGDDDQGGRDDVR